MGTSTTETTTEATSAAPLAAEALAEVEPLPPAEVDSSPQATVSLGASKQPLAEVESSHYSAAEVLAEVESSPRAAMSLGAFAGVALLAGLLHRGRRAPSSGNVPLLDEEA